MQAKLSHLNGHLSVHIPELSHRFAMAELDEGPRVDRGRPEPGFKCFGVIVWQLCKVQVDIGSGHFLSQSPVMSEQEAGAPEPWQVGLVEEWDLPVWVCWLVWIILSKTYDLPLWTVKSASKLVQCHFILLFQAKLMPLSCDSPVTLLCMWLMLYLTVVTSSVFSS